MVQASAEGARAQRELSREEKGSRNHDKACTRVARVHDPNGESPGGRPVVKQEVFEGVPDSGAESESPPLRSRERPISSRLTHRA